MPMIEYREFYNDGFGYVCRHCVQEFVKDEPENSRIHPRYMREGESESKQPKLSIPALAKWLDKLQTTLICPNCGITERID